MAKRRKATKADTAACAVCGNDSFLAGKASCPKWDVKAEERGDCGFWLRIEARRRAEEEAKARREEWERANPEEVAIRAVMREYTSMNRAKAIEHLKWRRRQIEFDAMPKADHLFCARYVLAVCPATAKTVMGGTKTLADAYDEITAMPVHQQLLLSLLAKHDPDATGSAEVRARVETEWAAITEGRAPLNAIPLFDLCEAVVTNAEARP